LVYIVGDNTRLRIQWAPKVKRSLIHQVYQAHTLGLVDEERILALGFELHQRFSTISPAKLPQKWYRQR